MTKGSTRCSRTLADNDALGRAENGREGPIPFAGTFEFINT